MSIKIKKSTDKLILYRANKSYIEQINAISGGTGKIEKSKDILLAQCTGRKIRRPRKMLQDRNGINKKRLIKTGNSETEERATAHLKTI